MNETPSFGLKTLRAFHMLVIIWVLFGWMISWPVALIIHIVALPVFIVHWKTNDGQCILTNLETTWFQVPPTSERAGFTRRLYKFFFKKEATQEEAMRMIYILMGGSALLSAIHLFSIR